ncbi:hypothetical protein GE061_007749 [Apolygus lucorum]|uniref:Uncharacterized protein n=1 Tax=Apolygus lucorum TaxID=248454 RepID=A0A8S9WP51_APOLU|nr:hypothetical protein GE061_007749 [Apolygus lucorum]
MRYCETVSLLHHKVLQQTSDIHLSSSTTPYNDLYTRLVHLYVPSTYKHVPTLLQQRKQATPTPSSLFSKLRCESYGRGDSYLFPPVFFRLPYDVTGRF